MWIAFALGWIVGSASLYIYIFATAAEAPEDECVECGLSECTGCPYLESPASRLAA